MLRTLVPAILLLSAAGAAATDKDGDEIGDLYYGEALFYAHQGLYFEALARLDAEVRQHEGVDEPELDTLHPYIDDAEFALGDFELRYRMHHRAGRAIRAVLEGAVDDSVRNDAAYRLARIHFQKGQMRAALRALDRIDGRVPEGISDDIEFLRANVYLAQGKSGDAVDILKKLQGSDEYGAFAAYNLGIALLAAGEHASAYEQLDRAGQREAREDSEQAIRDKANLVLGTRLLEAQNFAAARPYLNRVRLDGPFSNQALLSAGWASVSADDYERAVVPWSILAERDVTDPATQEAMLALPYAYGKLSVHGRAAVHYGQALDAFGGEVEKLTASIDSIEQGKFLEALIREEIRQSEEWVVRLRTLPEAPETYYLIELLASHDFQAGLQNYLDLADLRRKLEAWENSFSSFNDMVDIRREHYMPLLPEVDEQFRKLDSRIRLRREQHDMLVKRKEDMLTTPRPEFLATREEQVMLRRLELLETELENFDGPVAERMTARLERVRGVITWTLATEYHERLARFDENLANLNTAMATMQAQYDAYVRTRQAATHSFEGYERPMDRLRRQVTTALATVDRLMQAQGRKLEAAAVEELIVRRERLETYRDKARFALADSYDRATQKQARMDDAE